MTERGADRVFRAVLKNAASLGTAKIVGAVIGLGALVCATRTLTAAEFGTLMLIHTYALGVGALTKFQSWQMILKFGGRPYELGNRDIPAQAIRFALGLDIVSGLLGAAIGVAALGYSSAFFGIALPYRADAMIYCTLIPTMTAATPTGVLRLLDRFDLISRQQIVTPVLRGIGAFAGWMTGAGLPAFLMTWYLADLAGDVVLWVMSIIELRRRDMHHALRPSLIQAPRGLDGVWRFVWLTNLNTTLDACWSPLGNLVVGGVLGPVAAGRYKIATTLLDSAVKPARFLEKGFFPEIMRLDPTSTQPWRLALKTGALSAGLGLVLTVIIWSGGPSLISLFGQKYIASSDVMTIMSLALIFSMGGFPLESLLYMAGQARMVLLAQIVSVMLYMAAFTFLSRGCGLIGAAWAYVLGVICLQILCGLRALSAYRDRHGAVSAVPS